MWIKIICSVIALGFLLFSSCTIIAEKAIERIEKRLEELEKTGRLELAEEETVYQAEDAYRWLTGMTSDRGVYQIGAYISFECIFEPGTPYRDMGFHSRTAATRLRMALGRYNETLQETHLLAEIGAMMMYDEGIVFLEGFMEYIKTYDDLYNVRVTGIRFGEEPDSGFWYY